jgi:hypothetical protein
LSWQAVCGCASNIYLDAMLGTSVQCFITAGRGKAVEHLQCSTIRTVLLIGALYVIKPHACVPQFPCQVPNDDRGKLFKPRTAHMMLLLHDQAAPELAAQAHMDGRYWQRESEEVRCLFFLDLVFTQNRGERFTDGPASDIPQTESASEGVYQYTA